jgi:MSHA pilin protein MshA
MLTKRTKQYVVYFYPLTRGFFWSKIFHGILFEIVKKVQKGERTMKRRSEGGFTLIELVMVIVIIGILAAIAVPKYIDLATNAEIATAKAYAGALRSAAAITYANVAVGNVTGSTTGSINLTSVYSNLQETGGLFSSGSTQFTGIINAKTYRWLYTAPMTVADGTTP